MPALQIDAAAFAALDPTRQSDYRQNGERYDLILDGDLEQHSSIASHITGLKNTNATLKTDKTQLGELAKAYQALGKKPEEIKAILDAHAAAETKKQEEAGNYQTLISQAAERHATDLKAATDSHAAEKAFLERVVEKNLIDRAAAEAIIEAGGDKDTVTTLLPHVKAQLKAIIEGEGDERDYVVRVMQGGNPRVKDAAGNLMGIKDLALELKAKPEFMRAFPAQGGGGGGASNATARTNAGAKTMQRAAFFQLPPAEQSKFSLEGGVVTD